ncbi:MAG TPA: TetR/AcrR family transcriptional regulator [Sphingomonadales bacterium]|nr:TetR/AcrR family transcriptional regulator [Sphingomonadales bacterium]
MTQPSGKKKHPSIIRGNTKTTREDWLAEARRLLIEEGVGRVKVDRIAKNLAVTRGGFYWFFKSRQDLLDILLAEWQDSRNDPLIRALKGENQTPLDPLIRLIHTLIREHIYCPALESAIRDWARTSPKVRHAVEHVDTRRIEAMTEAYQGLGYSKEDAFIRARIQYFHQVGYYAMEVHETLEQRLHYLPIYFKQLTGFDLPRDALTALRENDPFPVY